MTLVRNLHIDARSDGRLARLSDWNEAMAEELASLDGLKLGPDHWTVIKTMREYYHDYRVSPVKKLLKRNLRKETGSDRFTDQYLDELFPGGVQLQGTKIAGIPAPHLDAELERERDQGTPEPGQSAAPVAHFVESFAFEGKTYRVSRQGNLLDLHLWNARLANYMAEKEGITLSEDHWEVINFLREFYFTYGISPMVKILMKYMAEDIGPERASRDFLYHLFPKGPARQGSRIAGLPEPQGCIDPDT